MGNEQYPALDELFLSILNTSEPNEIYSVMIFPAKNEEREKDLERRLEGLPDRPSKERHDIIEEVNKKMLKPIIDYLSSNGANNIQEKYMDIDCELTTEKILDLAKKDYVDYIHNKGDLRPIAVVC